MKKNLKIIIPVIVAIVILSVIGIVVITNNNKKIDIIKCPHCSSIVEELTEYHVCKNCYTHFMGLEALKQQQQLNFFKSCYNEKGEKIK